MNRRILSRFLSIAAVSMLASSSAFGVMAVSKKKPAHRRALAAMKHYAVPVAAKSKPRLPARVDPTQGDFTEGEDLSVRKAAVDALGTRNGTIVVTDASTGRILTIVNQKLALKSGFTPCSTIKIPVALAALTESVIDRETPLRLQPRGYQKMAMTEAIATSNNDYFARLGEKLGFQRVSYYAKMFGLGERATLDMDNEQPGSLPTEPPKWGGMGMMTSFGIGITLTPLEYAGIMGAVANGGTLYYLQYPKSQQEADALVPRVKRSLDIENQITSIRPGMMGAVLYGTAKQSGLDQNDLTYGKTGTCTDSATYQHLGWFGSFSQKGERKLVVVVLLTGSKTFSGPVASGVAGKVYKALDSQNYFSKAQPVSPVAMIGH